ncbi:hypothetical protein DPEC_G00341850 [Dallia pectoralis]|uniref:Uncharacterized protein n=1 Tax=Dallia pectoralis TaxID=75939 RepID=A0ACC2F5L7_DALPE|nr:hypothetical protein DPEC_G00341850 [Dallia pectoralis]
MHHLPTSERKVASNTFQFTEITNAKAIVDFFFFMCLYINIQSRPCHTFNVTQYRSSMKKYIFYFF